MRATASTLISDSVHVTVMTPRADGKVSLAHADLPCDEDVSSIKFNIFRKRLRIDMEKPWNIRPQQVE